MRVLSHLLLSAVLATGAGAFVGNGRTELQPMPEARFRFGGEVGRRIDANVDQWLLRAPRANPGLLGMFAARDRSPAPDCVPWAGEFAGKYLISAVEALRMTDRPDLRDHVAAFVTQLVKLQADDGYLGPFPKHERLLGHWDLWGHYHIMLGLLEWHAFSDDDTALTAARRIGNLVGRTFMEAGRPVASAGSEEMNMAVSHGLLRLHEVTDDERYLRWAESIVKEWERAGDYLRTGVKGVPFWQTPRPRWESLHDVQALAELWGITGDEAAKQAFASHWTSIRDSDRRNTGAFSGGEQATGNAFVSSAIETCCTVAWMALSVDQLRLTGARDVADELELSTLNAALGAQHPSGCWWTYDTPMDGRRESSAHTIVFQARAGTPDLNCCSVNGPRALGMLADWAVMRDDGGLTVNWLGPMRCETTTAGGAKVVIESSSDYPRVGEVKWTVTTSDDTPLRVRFRRPAWAGGEPWLTAERVWKGEAVTMTLPLGIRAVKGEREAAGRVSLYRGPLLLAFDPVVNDFDEPTLPRLTPEDWVRAIISEKSGNEWLRVELPAKRRTVRLCDFASAGATGTRYRTWLKLKTRPVVVSDEARVVSEPLAGPAAGQNGRAGTATRFDGVSQLRRMQLPEKLGPDYSVAVWVRLDALPQQAMGQIFSAWAGAMDDPLRLVVTGGRVSARIEAKEAFGTGSVPLGLGEWRHVAAVKQGERLRLYVDGGLAGESSAPQRVVDKPREAALGGNPKFTGPEFLPATIQDFTFWTRALSEDEVATLAGAAE